MTVRCKFFFNARISRFCNLYDKISVRSSQCVPAACAQHSPALAQVVKRPLSASIWQLGHRYGSFVVDMAAW